MSLPAEEIKDTAKWMMATSDASFRTVVMRLRAFMRGFQMNEAQSAEFIGILRGLDEYHIKQADRLMKTAQDSLNLTPGRSTASIMRAARPALINGKETRAASLISSVPDEFHDPEPEL